jgi:hypothetical protein
MAIAIAAASSKVAMPVPYRRINTERGSATGRRVLSL